MSPGPLDRYRAGGGVRYYQLPFAAELGPLQLGIALRATFSLPPPEPPLTRPLRLTPTGRGRCYSPTRGLIESILRPAMVADWPARAWGRLPWTSDIRLLELDIPVPLPQGVELRVAFASDIHVGPTTPMPLLRRMVERLNSMRADVLLLGGDYVFLDATKERLDLLRELIGAVDAPVKLGVWGNHDL